MNGAMAFIVLLTQIVNLATVRVRHVAPLADVHLRKKPSLKNARVSDAYQTLSAKPLMESALVSPDTAVTKLIARQLT